MSAPRSRPHVPDVLPLVRELYASPRGGAGCCLHVVLDDCNTEKYFVESALERALEVGHPLCERIARLMLDMSWTGRTKLAASKREPDAHPADPRTR